MEKIRLVIIDDHPLILQGVIDAFSLEPEFEVVGQTASGGDAVELILRLSPDIAIVDVNLPEKNGHQITREVTMQSQKTKIILLTAYDDHQQAIHAMRAGAKAYCAKGVTPEELVSVVHDVRSGKFVIGSEVLAEEELDDWLIRKTNSVARPFSDPGDPFHPLSNREMEVLECVTRGLSNKEIASELGISHQTVKNHVTAILRKLGVDDRTQAAVYALRRGWVRLYDRKKEDRE